MDSRYGDLPGTLPLNLIRVENTAGRNPDIVISYDFDVTAADDLGGPAAQGDEPRLGEDLGQAFGAEHLQEAHDAAVAVDDAEREVGGADAGQGEVAPVLGPGGLEVGALDAGENRQDQGKETALSHADTSNGTLPGCKSCSAIAITFRKWMNQ